LEAGRVDLSGGWGVDVDAVVQLALGRVVAALVADEPVHQVRRARNQMKFMKTWGSQTQMTSARLVEGLVA
jgi:hypothetical protein